MVLTQAKSYGMNNNDKKRSQDNCWAAHVVSHLFKLEKKSEGFRRNFFKKLNLVSKIANVLEHIRWRFTSGKDDGNQ